MADIDRVYVFGSFNDCGHHLLEQDGQTAGRWANVWIRRNVECYSDNPPSGTAEVEGEIAKAGWGPHAPPTVREAWSIVTWWDRQGNKRHGSHTGIVAYGRWTHQELVAAGRRLAPWAFRVPLGSWAGEVVVSPPSP